MAADNLPAETDMSNRAFQYTVRKYQPGSDVDAELAAIHLSIRRWQIDTGTNGFADLYDSQPDMSAIEEHYLRPGGIFFVAEDPATGAIVGFVAIRNDGNGLGTLKRLAVIPEYQKRGIATALVDAAVSWAKTADYRTLRLATGIREQARGIYERAGFVVVGFDAAHDDHLMELRIYN